jgi:hypothetical protein
MTTDHSMRASDQDREQVVEILRGQYTEGRLTLEEFDERTSAAYAGKTWGDLLNLTRDLPARPRFTGPALPQGTDPQPPPRPHGPPWPLIRLAPFLLFWLVLASMGGWFWGGPSDGRYHGAFFPIIPLVLIFLVIRALVGRRRRHWF